VGGMESFFGGFAILIFLGLLSLFLYAGWGGIMQGIRKGNYVDAALTFIVFMFLFGTTFFAILYASFKIILVPLVLSLIVGGFLYLKHKEGDK